MAPHVRPWATVAEGLRLSRLGVPTNEIAATLGVAPKTVRRWHKVYEREGRPRGGHPLADCPECEGGSLDAAA
jgi:hypothetical protein